MWFVASEILITSVVVGGGGLEDLACFFALEVISYAPECLKWSGGERGKDEWCLLALEIMRPMCA